MEEKSLPSIVSENSESLPMASRVKKILRYVRGGAAATMLATLIPIGIGNISENKKLETISEKSFWVSLSIFLTLVPLDHEENIRKKHK